MNNALAKRILINLALIVLNIIVFSGAFIGVDMASGSIWNVMAGAAAILFTIFVFLKVNCAGLLKRLRPANLQKEKSREMTTLKQCRAALSDCSESAEAGRFRDSLETIADQVVKFELKRDKVKEALSKSFDEDEMTYKKFNTVIDETEAVMIGGVRVLTNRMDIAGGSAPHVEFAGYLNETIANFTDVNSKMDRLLYELAVFSGGKNEGLDQNGAVSELQKLIDSVKWYR